MNKKLKIAIFIDHDIIIRHFIHSQVFNKLSTKHQVDFIFPPKGNRRITLDPHPYIFNSEIIHLEINNKTRSIWSRMSQVIALRPSLKKYSLDIRKTYRLVMNWKAEILHTFLGFPIIFEIFKFWTKYQTKLNKNIELINLLRKKKYDFIVNPGIPLGVFINDLFILSRELDIPLIYIMNSWDNPSTGFFAAGKPDLYLAWGPQTYFHAKKYQKINPKNIRCFGAAQFEIYKTKPKIDKNTFLESNNIPPNSKIILYAGGSLGTNEFEHLKLLEKEIKNGNLQNTFILYRPHPWGGGGNKGEKIVRENWEFIKIESTMKNYLNSIASEGYKLSFPDYSDTHVVLSYVDCVISPLSTILIEAAMHGKPIMCFLPMEDLDAKHFQSVHELPHFREFQTQPEVILAKNRLELINKIKLLFKKKEDPHFSEKILNMCKKFVSDFDISYSNRFVELLENYE